MKRKISLALAVGAVFFGTIFLFAACQSWRRPPAPRRVVIILIDTMRRDHVSAYGYAKPTTPNLDRIAAQGLRFARAVSASSWTQPAVASLFTSTYPSVHHVTRTPSSDAAMSVLPPELTTLAEFLKAQGFVTHAVTSHPYLSALSGFDQGFDQFETASKIIDEREPKAVMDRGLAWLERQPKAEKFFLYVHIMGPHFPYLPPPEVQGRFTTERVQGVKEVFAGKNYGEQSDYLGGAGLSFFQSRPDLKAELIGLYDEEILYSDEQVGRMWEALSARGLGHDTMLIILSDHGEGFLGHGRFGHGNSLFGELTDVPLIIYYPPLGQGRTVAGLVSLMDLFPTLVELFGADRPEPMQGVSLLPFIRGGKEHEPVLSELHVLGLARLTTPSSSLIFRPRLKVQRDGQTSFQEQETMFFNLTEDPGEKNNLAAGQPELADPLLQTLLTMEEENRKIKIPPAKPRKLDDQTLQELKALGYIKN